MSETLQELLCAEHVRGSHRDLERPDQREGTPPNQALELSRALEKRDL